MLTLNRITIKDLDFCKTLDNKAMISLMGGETIKNLVTSQAIQSKTYLGTKANADGFMARFYNVIYKTINVTETTSDATVISEPL